ncbi:hypothetical protein [Frankia sp. R82]|uniref:hypothetical protein n=1 Tax=Frankia sp. R82 TaxID=2950553 RepID=UPI002042C51D|nr:hypothetical protein [Frankia sp. R82]MCM3884141.1 hypothetical protein [Frankia sp. R82]
MTLTTLDPIDRYRVRADTNSLPDLDPFFACPRPASGLVALDLFAGAGGSSTGLIWAGHKVALAINHWQTAIESHSANHRDTDHWRHDLGAWRHNDPFWQGTNPPVGRDDLYGFLPAADILWASPVCKAHTRAQGKKQTRRVQQVSLWEHDDERPADEAAARSRATMRDVLRAIESATMRGQPFLGGIIENVPEVVDWEHWPRWCRELNDLGYDYAIVSLNSAFAADDTLGVTRAPQLRNRVYIIWWKRTLGRRPDLDFRVTSWCPRCEVLVEAKQSWKNPWRGEPVGTYGRNGQYWYRCPTCRTIAEPLVQPAADIINWAVTGPLVGDRERLGLPVLRPATRDRIAAGLARYGTSPTLIATGGSWNTSPASPADPFRTRTTTEWEALATTPAGVDPFLVCLRGGGEKGRAHSAWGPIGTVSAQGEHHAVVTAGARHMITSYYGNGGCTPTLVPLPTQPTKDRFALVSTDGGDVDSCTYRMLDPDTEIKKAMAFPAGYHLFGNRGDRTAQLGNAVTPNCSALVSHRLAQAILGERVA